MKNAILLPVIPSLALLVGGCSETGLSSTLPPQGIPNPRPLEVQTQTDKLVQVTVPEVDIMWNVDNSCSMYEEQNGISQNNPIFMDFFLGSGLDYHIGVTSTDMNDSSHSGRLRQAGGVRWIDEDTPNPSQVFSSMIEMGTSGSATEKGRDAVYGGLESHAGPGGYNEGFEREDAALHIVFLNDESDFSTAISLNEFSDYLGTKKWDEDMLTVSSIVTPPQNCPTASTPGDDYLWLTAQHGGIPWDVCDTNWDQVLELLGIQASGLKREYFLSQIPVPGTIEVWVEEGNTTFTFEAEIDWLYQEGRNSVIFNEYVPSPLSEVYVEYKVLGASEEEF